MNLGILIGVSSLIWSSIEILTGRAWVHREFLRRDEPTPYWAAVLFWVILGITCLVPSWW